MGFLIAATERKVLPWISILFSLEVKVTKLLISMAEVSIYFQLFGHWSSIAYSIYVQRKKEINFQNLVKKLIAVVDDGRSYNGRREERTTSWRELSLCMAALNSSKVTCPSLFASMRSNISSNFPGSVISAGRQSSGKACSM